MNKKVNFHVSHLILHAISQLTDIYFNKLNSFEDKEDFDHEKINISKMSYNEWEENVNELINHLKGKIPKLKRALEILSQRKISLIESIYKHVKESFYHNVEFVFIGEPKYPILLNHITNPPLVLNVLGNSALFQQPSISVIGSRKAHPQVIKYSYELGKRLAQFQIVVVSGGALGCDIAAHKGVLSVNDWKEYRAIVVLAGGLSSFYPNQHRQIFKHLLEGGGAVISERLFHQKPHPKDFSIRNRIISGLSYELIVMQAGEKSGSLQTAKRALDQGREVLVMRPDLSNQLSHGSIDLIQDGAYSFENPDDLLGNYIFTHENILFGNW